MVYAVCTAKPRYLELKHNVREFKYGNGPICISDIYC